MREPFKRLGVYINCWQPKLPATSKTRYSVMTVNNYREAVSGALQLTLQLRTAAR